MRNAPTAGATCLALTLLTVGCGAPSEARIRARFAEHSAEFETLARMSETDFHATGVTRIAFDFTRLEDDWRWPRPESEWGISSGRWTEYKRLFRRLDLAHGIDRGGEHGSMILFPMWGRGMLDNTRERGVLWSETAVRSLTGQREDFTVRPIRGDWHSYEWVTW